MPEELPDDVRAFICGHIPSVGHMESLVLTVEEPQTAWRAEDLAKRLFVPEAKAGTFLRDLSASGLVEPAAEPGSWRFARHDGPLADLAVRSVRLYRMRLLQMTRVIQSCRDPGRKFADAFRFWKE